MKQEKHIKNLEWLVETKERYGSNIPEGRYMFSYATPNNIFALRFYFLLYSKPIILNFWYVCIVPCTYIAIYLDYF